MEHDRRDDVYAPHVLASIERHCTWVHEPLDSAGLAARLDVLAEVEYLFVGWGAPVLDETLLAHAPRLKLVLMAAGSIRGIVTDAFWERGIPIVSAASANAIPVAEFTIAHVVLALKGSHRIAREMAAGAPWPPPSRREVPGVYRRTVGLVALGAIGRLVVEQLRRFEVHLLAHDPTLGSREPDLEDVTPTSLADVFAMSDVVSCHLPLLPDTRGAIDGALLRTMKHGATFLNTARGAVVREDELIGVLHERPDLTAVLDVTEREPLPESSPLRGLPNVFLTAHTAGSHGTERQRLGELVAEELDRHRRGEALRHTVTRASSATRA
ncbi:hydroxyacid dehydrogenase [Microbacterium xanthum]|uniref:hydroxyacid dehydrogenase n=1 Tax=Microbacterium xanthum TaxID=3079794 RepID=UPI002AD3E1CD|nr:hydroxyacid dehydrogenase [Microbacterium sp. KSW-48]MDZ8171167.1 hydroxyacid dehydrogenase [Microbacterium sp. KSW-48]